MEAKIGSRILGDARASGEISSDVRIDRDGDCS
jgi:hypothetical protein